MIPILHSVSYAGVWPGQSRLTLDEFLDKAADLGFPGVMLMAKRPHISVLDHDPEACSRLRDRMEVLGLRCFVIAGYTNFSADAEHGDIPHVEMQIQHVTELARIARDLGAGVVRVFTSYDHPRIPYAQLFERNVVALRECARRAAAFSVTVGVQNHHDLAVDHRSQRDLVDAVGEPNCKPIFDAWSPALHCTDIVAAAREMAPLTCHTTAADYELRPRFKYDTELINYTPATPWVQAVPMGDGFIDYAGFFSALREGGYDGPVGYEMCAPMLGGGSMDNLDRAARQFLSFMAEYAE